MSAQHTIRLTIYPPLQGKRIFFQEENVTLRVELKIAVQTVFSSYCSHIVHQHIFECLAQKENKHLKATTWIFTEFM